jgi:hypothetical protein
MHFLLDLFFSFIDRGAGFGVCNANGSPIGG